MSPPRRFYGSSPPGRLQATMLKVLAAEMSDAGRLRRGKNYFTEGAVLDIEVEPSVAEVIVQGSRSTPYEVALSVEPGTGVPTRREVDSYCSCPDAERHDYGLCKHGVAAMFALANEVAIEPDLLARWRSPEGANVQTLHAPSPTTDGFDDADGHLAPVTELFPRSTPTVASPERDLVADHLNRLLVPVQQPGADPIPDLGEVTAVRHPSTGDPLIDGVLSDVLSELHLNLG